MILKRAKGKVAAVEIKGKFGRNPSMTMIFTCPSTSSMNHSLTLIKILRKYRSPMNPRIPKYGT